MDYKVLEDKRILVRLDPDDEIVTSLGQIAQKENLQLAMVQGLGAVKKVVMGVYDVTTQQYHSNTFEGAYEIVSLTGTMDTMKGQPYSHFHICIGDMKGHAYGGHLNEAVISATAEIVITPLPGAIDRTKSPEVGLNIWQLN